MKFPCTTYSGPSAKSDEYQLLPAQHSLKVGYWFVTHMNCGKTAERIKMKLRTKVGVSQGHMVLGGGPGPPMGRGHVAPSENVNAYRTPTIALILMKFCTKVGLSQGQILLGW